MSKNERKSTQNTKYINEWLQQNYSCVSAKYPTEYVAKFREACKKIGISQSSVFKEAMQSVIDKAESL